MSNSMVSHFYAFFHGFANCETVCNFCHTKNSKKVFCWCVFSHVSWDQFWSGTSFGQLDDFSSLCILACTLNPSALLKLLSHLGQSNGLSLELSLCDFSCGALLNIWPHFTWLEGFSPVCVLKWFFITSLYVNWMQLNSFVGVCIFLCVSRSLVVSKISSGSSSVWFLCLWDLNSDTCVKVLSHFWQL